MAKGPQQNNTDPVDDGPPQAPLEGEVLSGRGGGKGPPAIVNQETESMAIGLTRAEVDQQIATAKRYPRSITQVKARIEELATLDKETAAEMIYARPQAGEIIRGPSVRFAEIVAACYGNLRVASRTVHEDKTFVESEGIVHDLEANVATLKRVRRRIIKRDGGRYAPDQIIVTANAGASIAMRNAVLAAVPKPLWREAIQKVEVILKGSVATLGERRRVALDYLKTKGVEAKRVFGTLQVKGEADITLDHLVTLQVLATSLRTGEGSIDELFPMEAKGEEKVTTAGKIGQNKPEAKEGTADGFNKDHVDSQLKPDEQVDAKTGEVTKKPAERKKPAAKKADAPKEEAKPDPKPETEAETQPETETVEDEVTEEEAVEADAELETEVETEVETETDDVIEDEAGTTEEEPTDEIHRFLLRLRNTEDWNAIKEALGALYKTDDWKAREADDQSIIRATIWEHVDKLITAGTIKLDFVTDPSAFRLWIDFTDDADAIEGNLAALEQSERFQGLGDSGKAGLRGAAARRAQAIRGSAA